MNLNKTITMLTIMPHGNEVALLRKIQEDILFRVSELQKKDVKTDISFLPFDVSFCPLFSISQESVQDTKHLFTVEFQKKVRDFIVSKSLEFTISSLILKNKKVYSRLNCLYQKKDFWNEFVLECMSLVDNSIIVRDYKSGFQIGGYPSLSMEPSFTFGFYADELLKDNEMNTSIIESEVFDRVLRVFTLRVIHFSFDSENPMFIEKEIEPPIWVKLK